ncbi:hypothetical protein D8674_028525 [Pyrus ussuriensis x Pyrus communis]|uniref:Uncharacterized protein n=1 Tax=Pyrus ussuriensis x Pyrus communis TaxID=2448454 RepID=A0A5N5HXI8_9ROSA|nr:hypothetical protein D8674_028525 [Pyrus ussuriensis x Pyrus communis]
MLINVKSAGTENWEGNGRLRLDGSSQKVMMCSKEIQVVDVIEISPVGFDVSPIKDKIISCIQINVLEAKA